LKDISNNCGQSLTDVFAPVRPCTTTPGGNRPRCSHRGGGAPDANLCFAKFLQSVSPVLAIVWMSVRHTLALSENDASYDQDIFTDG